jgi:hypothetical protein
VTREVVAEVLRILGDEKFLGAGVFEGVVSCRFVHLMEGKGRENFEVFGDFLAAVVKEGFLTVENLNQQFVQLYREEWGKVSSRLFYFFLKI